MNKKTIGIVIATVAGAAVVIAGGIGISKYVSHQKTEHRIHNFESSAREKFESFRNNNIENINSLNDDHYMKKSFFAVNQFVGNPNATQLVGEFVKVGNEPGHWKFKNPKDDNKSGKDGKTILKNWEAVDKFVDEAKTFFEEYTTSSSKKSKKVGSREDSTNPGQAALPTETEQQSASSSAAVEQGVFEGAGPQEEASKEAEKDEHKATIPGATAEQELFDAIEESDSQEDLTDFDQPALLTETEQQQHQILGVTINQKFSKAHEDAEPQKKEASKEAEEDRLQGDPTSFVRDALPAEARQQSISSSAAVEQGVFEGTEPQEGEVDKETEKGEHKATMPGATAGQALSKTPEGTEPQKEEVDKKPEQEEAKKAAKKAKQEVRKAAAVYHKVNDPDARTVAANWGMRHRTPVRAIKWNKQLCWLHAIILLLFHDRNYNELIRNFPTETAWHLIDRGLSPKDKACLKFMIYLSEVFNILMRNHPNVLVECVDLSKTGLEEKLVNRLAKIFPSRSDIRHGEMSGLNTLEMRLILDNIFKIISDYATYFPKDWAQSYRKVINSSMLIFEGICGNYDLSMDSVRSTYNHVYVSLRTERDKTRDELTLGEDWAKSRLNPLSAINVRRELSKNLDDYDIRFRYGRMNHLNDLESYARRIMTDLPKEEFRSKPSYVLSSVIEGAREELAEAKKHGCSDEDCNPLIDAICNADLKLLRMQDGAANQKLEDQEVEEVIRLAKDVCDKMNELIEKEGFNRKKEIVFNHLREAVFYTMTQFEPDSSIRVRSLMECRWYDERLEVCNMKNKHTLTELSDALRMLGKAKELAKKLDQCDDEGGSGDDLLVQVRKYSEELRRFSLKLADSQSSKKS